MTKSKRDILIQFAAVLLSCAFLFYRTWPVYAFNLLYKEADASVESLFNAELKIKFFNEFEQQEVAFTRELAEGEIARLTGPVLQVRYAWSCPDELIIYSIGKIPTLWLPVMLHLVFLVTIIACGKRVVKAFARLAS